MGAVVRTTSEPMVGHIRLAWWRERLAEIDRGIIPAEPHLQDAAEIVANESVTGIQMSRLADGWAALLDPFPWGEEVASAIAGRGRDLFGMAARIIGAGPDAVSEAGSMWALVDVARHCSDPESRDRLIASAQSFAAGFRGHVAEAARPLAMLGLLASRDLDRWPEIEPEGTPGRAWVMIRHRLTGRV